MFGLSPKQHVLQTEDRLNGWVRFYFEPTPTTAFTAKFRDGALQEAWAMEWSPQAAPERKQVQGVWQRTRPLRIEEVFEHLVSHDLAHDPAQEQQEQGDICAA